MPYTYQEADKPEPPDIIYSEFDANASVMSTAVDAPAAEKELEVLSYLWELFDETVTRSKLSSANQRYLAEVLRCNISAFATGPMDIGFCDAAQHNVETRDGKPI